MTNSISHRPKTNNGAATRTVYVVAWLLYASCAHAAEDAWPVVAIQDGDTLTILVEREQRRIRLAEIDAPEKKQPFGTASKQSLSELCFGKNAVVEGDSKDRYGRTIAHVHCDDINAGAEQVRRGMAWVYDRYAKEPQLYTLQDEARRERRGLWSDAAPVQPWVWRRTR